MDQRRKIAYVEDDPDMIDLVEFILTRNGYDVVSIRESGGALTFIAEEKPDLLLLDLMMPGPYDGFEIYQKMQEDNTMKHIPVIMVTAVATGQAQSKALYGLGMDDFISKAFRPDELIEKIEKLLSKQ